MQSTCKEVLIIRYISKMIVFVLDDLDDGLISNRDAILLVLQFYFTENIQWCNFFLEIDLGTKSVYFFNIMIFCINILKMYVILTLGLNLLIKHNSPSISDIDFLLFKWQ